MFGTEGGGSSWGPKVSDPLEGTYERQALVGTGREQFLGGDRGMAIAGRGEGKGNPFARTEREQSLGGE